MRIISNSITAYSNPIAKAQDISIQNSQKYVPTFCGQYYDTTSIKSPKFLQAKAYLDKAKDEKYCKEHWIYEFDLNKLDGIQDGIKVFDGLNMKEIAFISQTLTEICVNRGCHNMCSHCYASAKPPIREDENHINKISWEDFTNLTDGYKELNNRLGFSIINTPHITNPYMTTFHDADGINICLEDKNGESHDFIDIEKRLYEATNVKQIFDTAGWSPKDKKAQARAEKYAKYYSQKENMQRLDGFNISVNPYHALHTRAVILEKTGDLEKANKFRDLYTTRMANVLFTFTPLLKYDDFFFIARAADNKSKGTDGFRAKDLKKLYDEIFEKLEKMYEEDYKGERKVIKSPHQSHCDILAYKVRLGSINTEPSVTERLEKIYSHNDEMVKESELLRDEAISNVKKSKNILQVVVPRHVDVGRGKGYRSFYYGILDVNGKYYLTDFYTTFPTEVGLNFENKDKKTAEIYPYLQEDTVIKKSLINTIP